MMAALIHYEAARSALAEALSIDEVKDIHDKAEAMRAYARMAKDTQLEMDAVELRMRAERRLGLLISEEKQAGRLKTGPKSKASIGSEKEPIPRVTLDDLGIDKKLSSRAQKRSSIAERAFEAVVKATRDRIASGHATVVSEPINGARALMGSRQEATDSLDYFPTPPWATRALIELALPQLGVGKIKRAWEPACGEGHIAEVLSEYIEYVLPSDIFDYGYGQAPVDFLGKLPPENWAEWIITNPPFEERAEAFVLRALEKASVGVAMFFRLQWIPTVGRYNRIFGPNPPTLVAFFSERVPLVKGRWDPTASTATDYVWLVWLKGSKPQAPFWIPPGQREALTRPDDIERFTAQPVTKRVRCDESFDSETGEIEDNHSVGPDQLDIPKFLQRPTGGVPVSHGVPET